MELREAKRNDIEEVSKILLEVADLHEKERPDIFKPKTLEEIKKDVSKSLIDKNSKVIVYEEEKILGAIIYKTKMIENNKNLRNAKNLWVDEIGVKEGYKKHGIGKKLMSYAKEEAKKGNYNRLELNCWSFNENAIEFYKKIGMKEQRINLEFKI